MKVTGHVKGFEEFDKLLRELPQNVENKVLQTATRKAARSVVPLIKAAAPTHTDERSKASKEYGTLKSNIRTSNTRGKKGQRGTRIHTGNAFWGYIYEMGSRFQAARPWFAPAFSKAQGTMIKTLGDEIGKGIEREAEKGYKGGRK